MRRLSVSVTSSRRIRRSGGLAATLFVIVGLLFCSVQGSAAQGMAKPAKVAILSPFSPPEPGIEAFVREVARRGWVEGENLSTEVTSVHGKLERLFTIFHRQKIAALALDRLLPSVFGFKEFVDAGGLIS